MAEGHKIEVNVGDLFNGLGSAFFIVLIIAATDMEPKHRAKEPYSLGAAIGCHIGGPNFCPAGHP